MEVFQRTIHSSVKRLDEDRLLVSSSLLDLEHSFHLELVVHTPSAVIESARASMSKTPLRKCLAGTDGIECLAGLKVGRGIVREVYRRYGGPKGCAHMVELITDALRLVSMLLIGDTVDYWAGLKDTLSEDEIIRRGREKLKNSCLVFAEE